MAVPSTVSGKVGKGLIGLIPILITEWTVDDDADDLDATTAEDDGFGVADVGVQQLSGTVKGKYIVTATKIASHRPGRGTGLKLYTYSMGADVGPFWDVPNFAISNFNQSTPVRGEITFSFRFKSRGTYTAPVDPS
jgi:hypothetical protein